MSRLAFLQPGEQLRPGDFVRSFQIPLINGETFLYTVRSSPASAPKRPLVILGYKPGNSFSETLWFKSSLQDFWSAFSPNADFLFVSYGSQPQEDVSKMQQFLQSYGNSTSPMATLHFGKVNPMALNGSLPTLLKSFGGSVLVLNASWLHAGSLISLSMEPPIGGESWLPEWPLNPPLTGPIEFVGGDGLACDPGNVSASVSGRIALISRGNCSFFDKVSNAQSAHAIAVLIYSQDGMPPTPLSCTDACANITIPAKMISFAEGTAILNAWRAGEDPKIGEAYAYFLPSVAVGIDPFSLARTFGPLSRVRPLPNDSFEVVGPELAAAAIEARGWLYEGDLWRRTDQIRHHGNYIGVELLRRAQFNRRLEFEAALPIEAISTGRLTSVVAEVSFVCPEDEGCGPWDFLASLWLVTPDNATHELVRAITAYGRAGHWLVDASSLLPLVASPPEADPLTMSSVQRFSFGLWNAVQNTTMDLLLHFTGPPALDDPSLLLSSVSASLSQHQQQPQAQRLRPSLRIPLFEGVFDFVEGYNKQFVPQRFSLPDGAQKVELWTIITGHGFGNTVENCAEFCDSQHEFEVDSGEKPTMLLTESFPEAGTLDGCTSLARVDAGVTPNQYGSWYFGRSGWCPGWKVEPHVFDVTSAVSIGPGSVNTVTYRGLYNGTEYVPTPSEQGGGGFTPYIALTAFIVVFSRS